MRISDWSSDVCSSYLRLQPRNRSSTSNTSCYADWTVIWQRRPKRRRRRKSSVCFTIGGPTGRAKPPQDPLTTRARENETGSRRLSAQEEKLDRRSPRPGGWTCSYLRLLRVRSEEHTSELQSLMRISYAVFCLKKKKTSKIKNPEM